jgi:hypothetical protein
MIWLLILLIIPLLALFAFEVTYVYDTRVRLGDDEGSEGEEDVITDLDRPGSFELKANITKWSNMRRISMSGYKVRGVRFYFPPGCKNNVKIKLTWNGNTWIPQENYSDPVQGDDKIIYIPTNKVIGSNDYVNVWYRNLDASTHRIDIQFDIINQKTSSMVREDPGEKRMGREAELDLAQYYYHKNKSQRMMNGR